MIRLDWLQTTFFVLYAAVMAALLLRSILVSRRLRLGTLESVALPLALVSAGVWLLRFYSTGKPVWETAGILIAVAGGMLGIWSFGHLGFTNSDDFWLGRRETKPRTLAAAGPYRYVRHPLYVGLVIQYLGVFLVFMHPLTAAVYAAAVIYGMYTSVAEERFLAGRFPQYAEYQRRVGRFFPRLKP